MKAITFTHYGPPSGLELQEVPKPRPGDDELLIRVHASSINSWDWEFLNGTPFINRLAYGLFKPRPEKQILGSDIAGTVEAVGGRVTRFRPGDEVFGDLWDSWGGFAEYACAREPALELKPTNSTFEEAAAVPQAGVLALQGLRKAGQLKPGQKVLINGAGGGVGTFAIQMARLCGAEVTAVDASHKLEILRSLGADHVIDYGQEDFTKTGDRYDLIVDCQNYRSMYDNKAALKPGGTYAMIGGSISRVYQLWLLSFIGSLTRENRKLRLVAEGPNKGLAELRELIETGRLVSVIDRTFQLREVPQAMRYFGEGRHKGKIAITVKS
ncbi:MAG: NAD(P)-dependent alcohol dehydrogenase [Gammaproteobacteria bacterium]|nr:NAD(P)-dependent alcohol dehydrogenase [Gammaproteobacteria bacterium]MDH3534587.1 NAD(P)-dependent alcohol dehydrogenase [Gammaproteobacteria bacterium]